MKTGTKIAIFLSSFLFLAVTGAGWYFSGLVIKPAMKTYEETYRIELEKGRIIRERFEVLPFETVFIPSPEGYRLHALFLPSGNSGKTVVFAHGFTFSLLGSVKYMDIFRRLGFNILMYDHRHHGKSGGDNVTFGFYEAPDLSAVLDWVVSRQGEGGVIGIHGESIGAAVALQHAAIDHRASFYISDGSFTSLPDLLRFRLKADFGLPALPLYHAASLMSKLRAGFFFGQISPLGTIGQARAPILFIHGGEDNYIPTYMARNLYEKYPGKKDMYICPKAGHSESFWTDRAEYERRIRKFLSENGII